MSKSLNVIQTTAKVVHIVCRVLYILTAIGAVASLIGFVALLALQGVTVGDMTVAMYVEQQEGMHIGAAIASCFTGAVSCVAACVIFRYAWRYLAEELADGTPFTAHGALRMRTLGILATVLPLCREALNSLVMALFQLIYPTADITGSSGADIGVGLVLILLSYILAYGAERETDRKEDKNANGN